MANMPGNGHCHSFNGDGKIDILAVDANTGELFVFPHSGRFQGTRTYLDPVKIADNFHLRRDHAVVSSIDVDGSGRASVMGLCHEEFNGKTGMYLYPNKGGLNGMDTLGERILISGPRADRKWETIGIADLDFDGCDDIFGREKGGGNVHGFFNRREIVENDTYVREPVLMLTVEEDDWPLGMADFTGNGRPDMVVRRANGDLDLYEFAVNETGDGHWFRGEGRWFTVSRGWNDFELIAVTDVDLDGRPDMLAKGDDGVLLAFQHSGVFDPDRPLSLFREPRAVATGWQHIGSIS